MANTTTDDVFFSAFAARQRAQDSAGTQTILATELVEVILEAVDDGTFTVTYNATGQSSQDIQWCVEQLRQNGYGVTLSGSNPNIVITW
jgi:hypothetical protein